MPSPGKHTLLSFSLQSSQKIKNEERRQNVIDNPHIVDWFFNQRLENFIKHWFYGTLGAAWHWYRYEFQARGSFHCHGTAKLNNDPGLCELTEVALKGFLAEQKLEQKSCGDIENGKKAAEIICDYVDSLLSTWNPELPCENNRTKLSVNAII